MIKKEKWLFAAGACSIGGGTAYMISTNSNEHAITFISVGAAMIFIGILTIMDIPRRQIQDERTRYLGAMAASYSWVISYVLIAVLYLAIEVGIVAIESRAVLGILLFSMLATFRGCMWYFSRKGVVRDSDIHAYAD